MARSGVAVVLALMASLLGGCAVVDDQTDSADPRTGPVLASANGASVGQGVATAPLGVWRGGITMLTMSTRDSTGNEAPWFGTARASDPTAARTLLYPPSRTLLSSLNPVSSHGWTIAGVSKLDGSDPAASLATQAEGRDVLVYVHGFNETFDSAATSYAQFLKGLDFTGVPVLFTWPSRGALLDYVADRDSAMWSRDALEDTLTALARDQKVGRIHIVAHSMGGMVTLEALRSMIDRTGPTLSSRFGAIVFANPDVDIDVFRRNTKRLQALVPSMTVIISTKDRALELSSRLAGNVPRVGAADKAALDQTGVKVVDATDFGNGYINHDTFMTSPDVRGVVQRAIDNANNGPADTAQQQ